MDVPYKYEEKRIRILESDFDETLRDGTKEQKAI